MKDNIAGGATLWARKTIDSVIFCDKPDKWFKIWFYIVSKVNHKENYKFKRGEGFIQQKLICEFTKATPDQIKKCFSWLRKMNMISTKRSTRGTVIKVLKYNDYQNIENYKSTSSSTLKARKKHERSTTINKNDNNDKNGNNTTRFSIESDVYQITEYFLKQIGDTNQAIKSKYETYSPKQIENLIQQWCDSTDKLIRIDKASPDDIYTVISWLVKDEFWSTVIQSTTALRRNYAKMYAKAVKDKPKHTTQNGYDQFMEKVMNDRR